MLKYEEPVGFHYHRTDNQVRNARQPAQIIRRISKHYVVFEFACLQESLHINVNRLYILDSYFFNVLPYP